MELRRYVEMVGGPRVSLRSTLSLAYTRLWVYFPSVTKALKIRNGKKAWEVKELAPLPW